MSTYTSFSKLFSMLLLFVVMCCFARLPLNVLTKCYSIFFMWKKVIIVSNCLVINKQYGDKHATHIFGSGDMLKAVSIDPKRSKKEKSVQVSKEQSVCFSAIFF